MAGNGGQANPRARPLRSPGAATWQPLTPGSSNYYYSPLMSKALPAHIHPFRLARQGETLAGSIAPGKMPRLAEMLHAGDGHADFELRFGCDDSGQACVLGHVEAVLTVLCQRCLEPMNLHVQRPVRLALVRGQGEASALDDAYEPLLVGDEALSLSSILEDELILAMPNFARHASGECRMPPGADILDDGTADAAEPDDASGKGGDDNPFSVLKQLKPGKAP